MSRSRIELSFLNINGLTNNKLTDESFAKNLLNPFSVNCLVETFTNKDSNLTINGFNHFHSFRKNELKSSKRSSGGIVCYFRQKFNNAIQVIQSKHDDLLWIRFKKDSFSINRDIYLGIVYIIPANSTSLNHRTDSFQTLQEEIDEFSQKGDIILGGDFNSRIGLLPDYIEDDNNIYGNSDPEQIDSTEYANRYSQDKTVNSFGRQLIDLCLTRKLKILNGRTLGDLTGKFTCFKRNGNSVVDYVICSENILNKIPTYKINDITHFSDHCQLTLCLNIYFKGKETKGTNKNTIKNKTSKDKLNLKYIWNDDSKQKLKQYFNDQLLDQARTDINENAKPEQKLITLNDLLIKACNQCLHKQKRSHKNVTKRLKQKAFDINCYNERIELKRLGKLMCKYPNNVHIRNTYHTTKRNYRFMLKKSIQMQKERELKKLDTLGKMSIRDKWKIIKSFTNEQPEIDSSAEIPSNEWLSFYKSLAYDETLNTEPDIENQNILLTTNNISAEDRREMDLFLNKEISTQEILSIGNKLKNNKAVGYDNISNEIIKFFLNLRQGTEIIKILFNSTFGSYLQTWKDGLVRPIFKNGNKMEAKNYRGITLTSCLGKFFNQILCARLTETFEKYEIFPNNLMGFRPGMRTSNNVFILKSLIDKSFKNKEKLYCCFVDISKAFDRVWRQGLLYKLKKYGVAGKMLTTIENLYNDTKIKMLIGDNISEEIDINMGVKQGDPLSSFLFNVDMCNLCTMLDSTQDNNTPLIGNNKVSCLLWADDIVLISKSKTGLDKNISILESYCMKWRLKINTDKTKVIIFNKSGKVYRKEKFYINDKEVEIKKNYKYLGFKLDCSGNFNETINDLASKGKRALFSIYRLSTFHYISVKP